MHGHRTVHNYFLLFILFHSQHCIEIYNAIHFEWNQLKIPSDYWVVIECFGRDYKWKREQLKCILLCLNLLNIFLMLEWNTCSTAIKSEEQIVTSGALKNIFRFCIRPHSTSLDFSCVTQWTVSVFHAFPGEFFNLLFHFSDSN